jgi:SAM-dependent methyltransferase
VTALSGNAESIPMGDSSVDVVTVGQAYHWFDQSRANPEVARVLVDGGHLLMLWNHETPVPWVVAAERIMGRQVSPRDWVDHRQTWADRFTPDPFFSTLELISGAMTVSTTKAELLARCESFSSLSVRPPAERVPILAEIEALVADFPDPFDVDYATEAYWCRKLPLPGS